MDTAPLKSKLELFAKEEINPGAPFRDLNQTLDRSLWKKSGDLGLLGMFVEPEWGGLGLDTFTALHVFEHFAQHCEDQGFSFSLAAHLFSCVVPVWKYGSEEQKRKYLPRLVNGESIAAHAISEAQAGSDVFKMLTTAEKKHDGFLLNGTKNFCTSGPLADLALVYATTDRTKQTIGGISVFVLDKNQFIAGEKQNKLGLRSAIMSDLHIRDQLVPIDQVLGGVGGGNFVFHQSMIWERLGMSILHVGITQRLFLKTLAYVKGRKINNQPLTQFQSITHSLAEMHVEIESTRQLIYYAIRQFQAGKNVFSLASMAKLKSSELFKKCSSDILHLHGAQGLLGPNDFERAVRDAAASTIYSGTSEIHKNIIAGYLNL